MSTRNTRFSDGMLSLDIAFAEIDPSKNARFSDRGESVNRMIAAIDYDHEREARLEKRLSKNRMKKLFDAEMALADAGKAYLINVLLLIIENGSYRDISMRFVPKPTYFRQRQALLDFFS